MQSKLSAYKFSNLFIQLMQLSSMYKAFNQLVLLAKLRPLLYKTFN